MEGVPLQYVFYKKKKGEMQDSKEAKFPQTYRLLCYLTRLNSESILSATFNWRVSSREYSEQQLKAIKLLPETKSDC